MTSATAAKAARWDVFCRVVDNFGDAGIGWRLARQLATEHGIRSTLWIDRPETLARLVPGLGPGSSRDGVTVRRWQDAETAEWRPDEVADVVIAAFAAELPAALRRAMRLRRPVWLDLEHLSAEDWVESSHGLPSPKPDGLVEHFFFPGFTERTGGLLREADLLRTRDRFAADRRGMRAWLLGLGVPADPAESLLSLFCYPHAPADRLLEALAASGRRWRVLLPDGVLPDLPAAGHAQVVVQRIPFLPQVEYDRLLWACDANFVRGEDSVVRALWAARPLVWQPYPQAPDARTPKLRAFVRRFVADSGSCGPAGDAFAAAHEAWNTGQGTAQALTDWLALLPQLEDAGRRWTARAVPGDDLASRLVRFASCRYNVGLN
jgi:uncharacterized repeat protein (TIGR03837 family)